MMYGTPLGFVGNDWVTYPACAATAGDAGLWSETPSVFIALCAKIGTNAEVILESSAHLAAVIRG